MAGRRGVVLVFHEITGKDDASCRISPKAFKTIIERVEKGNRFVSVNDILDKRGSNRISVTFDDVPHSFLDNAYPILKEKGIPFTLFVCKKFVGMDGFLSEREIKELEKDPLCTVGAHSSNHTKLRDELDSNKEIVESKEYLEELLGHPVTLFAYPYGRYDSVSKKNRNEVKEVGFKAAFSTISSPLPNYYDIYFIPRIELIR